MEFRDKIVGGTNIMDKSKSYIMAYDFGTSGVKSSLVDLNGNLIGKSAVGTYKLYSPHDKWAEQSPDEYWDAVCKSTKKVIADNGIDNKAIKGVIFSAMWKGVMPCDKDLNPLYNSIIWLDGRASNEARELTEKSGLNTGTGKDYFPRLYWVKKNMPEIFEKTAYLLETNAFLKYKMAGTLTSDITDCFARSKEPTRDRNWKKVLETAGIPESMFPRSVYPHEKVGEVTKKAAEETGLAEGTPVFGGSGDAPAVTIGSGAGYDGGIHIYLGSSGWCGFTHGSEYKAITIGKDMSASLYGMQAVCLSFNWAISQFYKKEQEELGGDIFKFVDRDIDDVPPTSDGLIFTPWVFGEKGPIDEYARGMFFNMKSSHDRRYFINAVMEGVAYYLRFRAESSKIESDAPIRVVGGGASGDKWMQIFADVFNKTVEVPANPRNVGTIGVASFAMVGLGIYENTYEALKNIKPERVYTPNKENVEKYEKMYKIFCELYPATKDIYAKLNGGK